MTDEQKRALLFKCGRLFSPSAPVDKLDLFAGRMQQVATVSEAINGRGRHAILYGDRGVGKTSLVNILREYIGAIFDVKVIKVNCMKTDTFINVWSKAFSEIPVVLEQDGKDESGNRLLPEHYTLDQYLQAYEHAGPGVIRKLLALACGEDSEQVIVFDEFDTLPHDQRRLFSDTIKDLSDNSTSATLLLVGVAGDVTELISEHQSIDRCLTQILMPPMAKKELHDILAKVFQKLGMTIEKPAAELIVSLSQGYPHYTHLLGQEATKQAILSKRLNVTVQDASLAIKEAVRQTQGTVQESYYRASEGQRKGSLYPKVLLACALAQVDEMGYFRSSDVCEPLSRITNEVYEQPNFSEHLEKFSTDESRGPVLERWGKSRRYRYRFRNAMLKPFIIMKGLDDQILSGSLLEQLTGIRIDSDSINDQGSLFD